ncbi:5042_t:CDS:2 [Acaulospora colombiana]|uniref:5042_t:CDS:1 n=1 Tax=Acaulospora colombiana TaxID=27376 RepID=A0ACA9K6F3_9GLOM|nr:5042_t:CDS:2 [Acaulospora colombiana]
MSCSAFVQKRLLSLSSFSATSFPINITELNCPRPLIWYTESDITSDMYCIDRCCLSCPYTNNFYPEGSLDNTFKTFAVFGIISFFLMLMLALLFLLLPSQRNNQTTKLILLPLAISVCLFNASEFFTIQQRKSQCISPVLRANTHDNYNCAAQAFFTIGGAYAIAFWAALLMLHLHMISVWRSDFIIHNILYINIFVWSISVLVAIIPLVVNRVEAGNICFITLNDSSLYYCFMSFIYVAFLAHLMTFVYMTKVSIKANWRFSSGSVVNKRISFVEAQRTFSHVKTVFTLQWRAMLGAILINLTPSASIEQGEKFGRMNSNSKRSGVNIRTHSTNKASSSRSEGMATHTTNRPSSSDSSTSQKYTAPTTGGTASSSYESGGVLSNLPPSIPTRNSLGIFQTSDTFANSRRQSLRHITFEDDKRTSFASFHSVSALEGADAAALNNRIIIFNLANQRKKRQSRELAKKIARDSITEVSEGETSSDGNQEDHRSKGMNMQARFIDLRVVNGEHDKAEESDVEFTAKRKTFEDEEPEKKRTSNKNDGGDGGEM